MSKGFEILIEILTEYWNSVMLSIDNFQGQARNRNWRTENLQMKKDGCNEIT